MLLVVDEVDVVVEVVELVVELVVLVVLELEDEVDHVSPDAYAPNVCIYLC